MSQGLGAETAPAAAEAERGSQLPVGASSLPAPSNEQRIMPCRIGLLTGGGDKPYVLGLTQALTEKGVFVEIVGGDALSVPELLDHPKVNFLNLRGDQQSEASWIAKTIRVLRYYWRLVRYTATGEPKLFHILWNNKFECFDRTVLMLYYRLLGKRVVLTAHNVNAAKRDQRDSFLNRLSLRIQYTLADHIFVHTEKMRSELAIDFGIPVSQISVIPFGINQTVSNTALTPAEAKRRIGIGRSDKTLLFFGQIAPYKGLADLVSAFGQLLAESSEYRLIIAGKPKWSGDYWRQVNEIIGAMRLSERIVERIGHVPDEEVEIYFKAADLLVLPYTDIFQSGVLFLGYSFGLPAVVTDVGSLRENIIEGRTGFVCRPRDPSDLASTIRRYFGSPLFHELEQGRTFVKEFAVERYSWSRVATITKAVYQGLGC